MPKVIPWTNRLGGIIPIYCRDKGHRRWSPGIKREISYAKKTFKKYHMEQTITKILYAEKTTIGHRNRILYAAKNHRL